MNKEINRFSLHRILMLTGIEITERRRTLLLQSGMMALVLIVVACIYAFSNDYSYRSYTGLGDPGTTNMIGTYLVMLFIFGGLSASIMFSDLGNKEGRIRMLMRPGLAIEKFISRWLIYVVIFIAVFIISVCVADSVRCLVLKIRFPESHCIIPVYANITPEIIRNILPFHGHIFKALIFGLGIYLGYQSFFVLGATIWPRMSFPKTFAVFTGLTFAYIGIIASVAEICSHGMYFSSKPAFLAHNWYLILSCLIYGAILLNYVLAWRRVGETEVITTKR